MEEESQATRDEIVDGALEHYRKISAEACDWCSTVEHALEAYRRTPAKDEGEEMDRICNNCAEWHTENCSAAVNGLAAACPAFKPTAPADEPEEKHYIEEGLMDA